LSLGLTFGSIVPFNNQPIIRQKTDYGAWKVSLISTSNQKAGHRNQDMAHSFMVNKRLFCCVCDGVSGDLKTPHLTSQFVQLFMAYFECHATQSILQDQQDPSNQFNRFIIQATQHALNATMNDTPNLGSAATTFSCLMLDKHTKKLHYFICGDSGFVVFNKLGQKIMHEKGTQYSQFTPDDFMQTTNHTLLKEYRDIPVPAQLCAWHSTSDPAYFPPYTWGDLMVENGDTVVLASDGLWDNVRISTIKPAKFSQNFEEAFRQLKMTPCHKENMHKFWDEWFEGAEHHFKKTQPGILPRFKNKKNAFLTERRKKDCNSLSKLKHDDVSLCHIQVTDLVTSLEFPQIHKAPPPPVEGNSCKIN